MRPICAQLFIINYPLEELGDRETARLSGIEGFIETTLERLAGRIPEAIQEVSRSLPADFPSAISDPIFEGIAERAKQLRDAP